MNTQEMIQEINRLKKEKNAVILAHFYQIPEIQEIADIVGINEKNVSVKLYRLKSNLIDCIKEY